MWSIETFQRRASGTIFLRVRIRTPVVCYDSVRRVTEHRQMAAWHLRTMILALKHVLQDFFRRCGLSTGLFCTHPRKKCRRGRVTVGAGVKSIFTTTAPEWSLSGLMILKKNLSIHDTRSLILMYSLVQVKYADGTNVHNLKVSRILGGDTHSNFER